MANKGNKRHLKALSAPMYFAIKKKGSKYVIKQDPGRFTLETSVPLSVAIRKIFGDNLSNSEIKKILNGNNVKVNNKVIRNARYPIGLNDIVYFEALNKIYMIGIDKQAKLVINELDKMPEGRIQKIIGKYKTKGNKIMIRLYDGVTVSYNKEAKVNDSVVIGKDNKILKMIRLEVGAKCFVYDGVHVGETGTIKELISGASNRDASAKIESGNVVFDTLLQNIMVIE
ncbi:MAG: hypothetical protein ACP5TL_01400 [Candidatus Micrarchaeia archaeon]